MNLIIVESPTKAKTLGRFLGKDYEVLATMGHVVDLPKSKLGVDVEHDFTPDYVAVAKKNDVAKIIKKEAKRADKIYLATDPDREGEAIAKHVADIIDTKVKPVRVVFHEITESAVRHALDTPRDIDLKLYDAQQARRVLDRLVGYKLSPLLWKKVRRGLSAGRVQSVAVRLIVEREREIEAFVAQEFWEIGVEVKTQNVERKTESFVVGLVRIEDTKAEVKNKEQAESVVQDLEKAEYKISEVKKREVRKHPYPPFTTSTMAQGAARLFGWSARRTMSVAQKLYEEGLITYHRTDSLNLAQEAVFAARGYVEKSYGKDYVPEKPRFYKTKSRVAQEAHEAIRPTDVGEIATRDSQIANQDGEKLYELIWKRFVACQMAEARFDATSIEVRADKYTLRASGEVMKFEGWRKVYGGGQNAEDAQLLPEVERGDVLEKIKVLSEQKFTQPPPRFNEASIIKTLEKLGIGRPSTYAPTISTIQVRQYVEKDEGKFRPTSLGIAVNDFIVHNFPDIVDYQFTAGMEESLDGIARGDKEWVPVMREFWDPFSKKLEGVEETAERVKVAVEETGEKCPKCGEDPNVARALRGKQVIRLGRFGKFLSCSRFPDCDWKDKYVEKIDIPCPDCKEGDVIIKKTKRGKSFYGCSRYPDCKFASWKKPKDEGEESNSAASTE
ncbi:MAG: DNA topoisomerase I [Candidatus Blackburnbacteria bacterium RIFCSPHIGHO2_02_FULL_44_20]|uniref:DNA topoisomerase 1 n=1 Tax=Candidatus Blackburnbacteria bacterium RIFCSPHIGHO2_02_FULL_44_20 TaxID=1797516 RepID=A0A1G1V5W5_9BACT|nr:MAG: DNA topoisomerase I [Candidatus Blackburnbacteria bacterium RIFCSPHIGHO2_02_FULL_44_20]OGY11875.1 MAG: DNA topoisomerase I [Candidatus Blackburnbacteria bacterium RIFCSPHIGHO2_12_FULL_44_25]